MQRLQWNKDKGSDLPPLEREVLALKEENRRLQGLLELREDRTELERYQIQSRNRILTFSSVILILVVGSWFMSWVYLQKQISDRNELIKQDASVIYKLKHGATYLGTDSDSPTNP